MLKTLLSIIIFSFAIILSPVVQAKGKTKPVQDTGSVPIPIENKSFNPKLEQVFEKGHFINKSGVNIYVVGEEFAMIHIETDVFFDRPMQSLPQDDERDMLLDYGYQVATYIIPALYGVDLHQIHVGNVYIGTPSMAPEGSIIVVDVQFVRDGLLWKGRAGIMTTDVKANDVKGQMWFVYPVTR